MRGEERRSVGGEEMLRKEIGNVGSKREREREREREL